ncbi:hypothetical protein CEP52_015605 [Fusarium oligoseptatum]|uniref:F-box domain-containing protein n=1 Tax=Fusarium oligoseptatum TaxID=2604345 RepID=A0A428SBK8_9HYPO|nr:hypothetical protein CEP52_015605 [Fusarium oligoseptatum]
MSDPQEPKATEIDCKDDSATSSQTPTNDQGPDNQEAPVEELPIRIEQPNDAYLVRMPSEVILSITEHMDRQSLKSLALTSARLHHTVSDAFYQSFNYETYRQALEAGDFAQIERCIEHNAAPSNVIWTKENAKPQFPFFRARRDLLPHLDHKPINYLDFAFHEGKMTADQCLFVLQRLVENGGDIATTWTDFNDELEPEQVGARAEFAGSLKHIPHYFLLALLKETDRTKLKGVANIIDYLSTQGFNFPRFISTCKYHWSAGI